ncbi:MBL fold metallo-hydrolase [Sporosarcina pasteurii]|uniref:Hydroxyacylglutathione hydrolase n=1 Tax=Sporosarcina pasteurii TaxID=1474 RepID=A0A380BNT9_SPOPA|nr:MBL fold metallo-hydrolase [Sporosarcina pasteurii]MDS9471072.1 MBL fold metallo-hydrolase [Sporosarcina pasteurii]QBQ05285.1 MBL fold metallo-hydrolase [Sporosarcina pasteurii]SUJ04261.1 hydroxyacylglutathione hydrolase [Sporosarcina pasteurii]
MLKITNFPLGPVQTNCYIIQDEDSNCLIIDPGEEGKKIITHIEGANLKPIAILLTHGHFDHIGAVDAVRDHFEIPVYIHEIEQHTLTDPEQNGSTRYPGLPLVRNRAADHLMRDEGRMKVGPFTFEARFTPGHSPGSVSFVFLEDGFAVVGDTLFQGSIGRTDLPGGDTETLLSSIHDKLLTLGEDVVIYPGHGPSTTPAYEMNSNPFLNGF